MRSYRQRIAVQRQPVKEKKKFNPFRNTKRNSKDETRAFILRALSMYRSAAAACEPLSDEEQLCRDEILKYTIDFEKLERGTYEERREVIEKYGRHFS